MTHIEYDLLCEDCPELKLPPFMDIRPEFVTLLLKIDREEMITRRTAILLRRQGIETIQDYFDPMTLKDFNHESQP